MDNLSEEQIKRFDKELERAVRQELKTKSKNFLINEIIMLLRKGLYK